MYSLAEKYLDGLAVDGKSGKTVITYRTVLNQFIKWFIDTNDMADIETVTPLDIKEYKQYMVAVLKRKPATVNKAIVTVKGFFEWATENDYIKVNPTRKVKLVEKQQAAPKWLERSEQFRLLRAVEQEKNEFKQAMRKHGDGSFASSQYFHCLAGCSTQARFHHFFIASDQTRPFSCCDERRLCGKPNLSDIY